MNTKGGVYDRRFEQDIQAAVKAVDKQQCYQATDEFCHYLATLQGRDGEVSLYLVRFVNTILLTAQEIGVDLGAVYPEGVRRIYRELLEVSEPDRERRYIKWKFIDPVISARMEYLESNQGSVVEEIKRRIADSSGSITLAECAQDMGVHPTYIWKTLKGEGGKSYSDYVEEYKLGEAKRLLMESDLTVAEIADRLGYTNAQNFIRFFSKSMGVTPGKFRKLC